MVKFAETFLGIKRIELKTSLSTVELRDRIWGLDQAPKRFQYNFTRVYIHDTDMARYHIKLLKFRRYRRFMLALVSLDGFISTGEDQKTVLIGKFKYCESYYVGLIGALIFGLIVASMGRDPAYAIFGIIFAAILLLFMLSIAHQQRGYLISEVRKAMSPLVS